MANPLRFYILILIVSIASASISSKCPELLEVPSDSSSALLVGMVQDVLATDKDGNYAVALLLEQIIKGHDVMKDVLSSQSDRHR